MRHFRAPARARAPLDVGGYRPPNPPPRAQRGLWRKASERDGAQTFASRSDTGPPCTSPYPAAKFANFAAGSPLHTLRSQAQGFPQRTHAQTHGQRTHSATHAQTHRTQLRNGPDQGGHLPRRFYQEAVLRDRRKNGVNDEPWAMGQSGTID